MRGSEMATTKISRKEMQQDEFIESVFDLGNFSLTACSKRERSP